MATTAVIPTYSVSGVAPVGAAVLPSYVADSTNTLGSAKIPPYALANAPISVGVLPTYSTNSLSFALTGTGGTLVGGGALIAGDGYIPTGGLRGAGAAGVSSVSVLRSEEYPRGGVVLNGTAPVIYYRVTGITMGGAAPNTSIQVNNYIIAGAGGLVVSGLGTIAELIPFYPSGGILGGGVSSLAAVYPITVGGGLLVSSTAPIVTTVSAIPSGGLAVSGSAGVFSLSPVHNPLGGINMAGKAVAFFVPKGGVVTTENPYNAPFNAWAINYETNAPSRYERLAANSMCVINGVTYVANAGGIYALDADNDAGQDIQASVSFGNSDFGEFNSKRMSAVYFGMRSAYKMKLTIVANKKTAYFYDVQPPKTNEHGSRLTPAKGLNGLFFGLRLDNQRGAYFELDAMTLEIAVSKRMGL